MADLPWCLISFGKVIGRYGSEERADQAARRYASRIGSSCSYPGSIHAKYKPVGKSEPSGDKRDGG